MSTRKLPLASLGMATALALVAGCGGGDKPAATTTSVGLEEETTTSLPTSTSTTVDPALAGLLLTLDDLPSGFEEQAAATARPAMFSTCDPTLAPAVKALYEAPSADGKTFERGTDGAVQVSSSAFGAQPDQAEPAITSLTDPKVVECLESDLRGLVEKGQPAGSDVTLKLTATKSTVKGADQTVLLASTSTAKVDATTKSVRLDMVFLRRADTVLVVTYAGTTTATTPAERQKIVAAAAAKLGGGTSAGTSTTEGSGSSTSTSRRTSTTRRSTTSTRSGSSTSSTRRVTTSTSSTTP